MLDSPYMVGEPFGFLKTEHEISHLMMLILQKVFLGQLLLLMEA